MVKDVVDGRDLVKIGYRHTPEGAERGWRGKSAPF